MIWSKKLQKHIGLFIGFFLLVLLSFPCFSQDAKPSQLSLIPEILNDFDKSITQLELNTNASNQTITSLQKTVSSMQTTINRQQQQLAQASENSRLSEQAMNQKLQNSESMLKSLETSLITLSTENQDLKKELLEAEKVKSSRLKTIFILSGILTAIIGALILFVMKAGGLGIVFGLVKKVL